MYIKLHTALEKTKFVTGNRIAIRQLYTHSTLTNFEMVPLK